MELKDDASQVIPRLQRVFGLVGISPARHAELDMEQIKARAQEVAADAFTGRDAVTFKVEVRRPNKQFPLQSPEIAREVGAAILRGSGEGVSVDVHNPQVTIHVEVRGEGAFIYAKDYPGPGGLPVGTGGRGTLLLSGGIDSPVAGWLAMKRGVAISGVYFHSFPFTTDRAKEKVLDLARVLARYSGGMKVHVVHFTELQKAIYEHTPAKLGVTIMRRMMLRIAEEIARREGSLALFTGESIGQVASQTLDSLAVTNAAATMPVLRPVITMDKREIIKIAQEIGTYEISVRPYEDCCTLFVPKHPETKPNPQRVMAAETKFDYQALIVDALEKTETIDIEPR